MVMKGARESGMRRRGGRGRESEWRGVREWEGVGGGGSRR